MNRHARLRCAALAPVAGAVLFMLWGCAGTPPAPTAAGPVPFPSAAVEERPEVGEWVSLALPDGAVFYARYGRPGGVRIHRGAPGAGSAGEASIAAVPDQVATPPSADAPSTPASAEHLAAQVRRILAEEIAALPVAPPRYRDGVTWPDAEPPRYRNEVAWSDVEASPAPSLDDRAASFRGPRETPAPAAAAASPAPVAPAPDTPAASSASLRDTSVVAVPSPEAPVDTLRSARPVEPRAVWEAFTGEGLFATQLLLFESGESGLLPISMGVLEVVAGVLKEFPEARLRVEGYTDHLGRADANLELSRRRAEAVRDFLVGAGGLGPERVEAVGYGEERPAVDGSSPTALILNRRVQIRVLNPEALRRPAGDR